MRRLFAAITSLTLLTLATSAFADVTPVAPPALTASPGNNCAGKFYPAQAVRSGEQGGTLIKVNIDETGKPTGVDVVASSGFADLDQASQDCVMQGWHFKPATQDGKPVASIKQYRIVWKLAPTSVAPHLQEPMEAACAELFADAPNRWTSYQSVTLQFRISTAGTVVHPFVGISSGDSLFDAKATQCVARLKYTAPITDNLPTEVSWNAAVRWSPHTGLAYADSYKLGPFCAEALYPANVWNGDPPDGTVISFHFVRGTVAQAVIEHSSGNPALDQAALQCVRTWDFSLVSQLFPAWMDFGDALRINWRDGHAFVLHDTWK